MTTNKFPRGGRSEPAKITIRLADGRERTLAAGRELADWVAAETRSSDSSAMRNNRKRFRRIDSRKTRSETPKTKPYSKAAPLQAFMKHRKS